MTLPPDFQFSQHNLQDYMDCPRRFELRYLMQLAWPALQTEPVIELEQLMLQGRRFHQMIQQSLMGIPLDQVSASAGNPDLARWWQNYLASDLAGSLPSARWAEVTLGLPFGGYRLLARYDLLATEPGGKAVIVDWKTSRQRPGRTYLADRLQTRVYPYLLVEAGARLNGGQPLDPTRVEMIYWFAEYPDEPVRFTYDTQQHAANHAFLLGLVSEIAGSQPPLILTTEEKRCRFCSYRSFCNRGVSAGDWREQEDLAVAPEPALEIDFEGIASIEF